jgi:hypothetical protein
MRNTLAIQNSPQVDAKNLQEIRYGIVSDAGNKTTFVILVAGFVIA